MDTTKVILTSQWVDAIWSNADQEVPSIVIGPFVLSVRYDIFYVWELDWVNDGIIKRPYRR